MVIKASFKMLPSSMNIELPEQRPKISSKRHTEMSADRTRPPSSRKTVIKHEPCSSTLSIFHDSYVYYFIIKFIKLNIWLRHS